MQRLVVIVRVRRDQRAGVEPHLHQLHGVGHAWFVEREVPLKFGRIDVIAHPAHRDVADPPSPRDPADDAVGAAFFTAFAALCGEWIANVSPLTLPSTIDRALGLALAHARRDPAGSSITAAARTAGLSERSLLRRCRAHIGIGWDEDRRRCRLLAAIEALSKTDASVARIAGDVGFDSQSAFARAFHRLTGLTPQAFRRWNPR